MKIRVQFLGGSRVQAGCSERELELEAGATVADAARRIAAEHPELAPLLARCRWARNLEFAGGEEPLAEGDELGLLPPVSGGANLASLSEAPLRPEATLARVAGPEMGATVLFIGTVRDHSRGKTVERLEYEVYPEMARRQLERIADACGAAHPQTRVAIDHRFGRLAIGEASVVIAAASAHRAEAFAACREAIEQLKEDVPIWKKEITTDGEEWVGWGS